MDIGHRGPDLSLEQKHSKPSASSWAGVKFVDVKEVGANHFLLYKQSLDVYGYTVHTGMMKGIIGALSNFAIKGSCSSTQRTTRKASQLPIWIRWESFC